METTIIKLDGNVNSNMVVRSATFEEAFGDFSDAKGRGRARRKKRKLERIANKREVRTERRKLKEDRQQERIGRRAGRKRARQEMRTEQQSARMGRRGARLDMRQQREDARQMRRDTRTQGEQGRANYEAEQELYREGLNPEIDETQNQGGYAPQDQDQGGYAPQDQDQGGYAPQEQDQGGYFPQENNSPMPQEGWGGGSSQDLGYDQGYDQGAYGDDNTFENDYNQEQDEFGDEGYFNAEGMEGKAVVSPYVKDNVQKLKNNVQAYAVLSEKRNQAVANNNTTEGLDRLLARVKSRCLELKSNLDNYSNASGDLQENVRRKREVRKAMAQTRKRKRLNKTAVQSSLQPQISSNRIEIPSASNFDAYSDLGRPIIVNGAVQSDMGDIMEDIYSDTQPTTIEMQSSFSGENSNKTMLSILLGVGVGALALYFAKRKGWI